MPTLYVLSAVVYAERDGRILLLQRAAGAALDGPVVSPRAARPIPESFPKMRPAASCSRRAVCEIDGDLELVGVYPICVYGHDCLQVSYRGVCVDGDVVFSDEHDGEQWVSPADMRRCSPTK